MNYQNLWKRGIASLFAFMTVVALLLVGGTLGHVSFLACFLGTVAAGVAAFVTWYGLILPLYEVTDERNMLLDREKALANKYLEPPVLEPDALTLNLLLELAHAQKDAAAHLTARIKALRVENQTLTESNRVLSHDLHAHREASDYC